MLPARVALALLCTAGGPARRAHGWGNSSASRQESLHTSEPDITRAVADGSLATVEEWLSRGGDVEVRESLDAHPMLLHAQLASKDSGGTAPWWGPAALGAGVLVLTCGAALPALLTATRRRTGQKARRAPHKTGQYASKAKKAAAAPEQQLDASQLGAILAHAGGAARAAAPNATPALPPVRRLDADRKVMLWHAREQRKLSWAECPSESELCRFLEEHPDMDMEVWCEGEQRGWALPPVEQPPAGSNWAPLKPAKPAKQSSAFEAAHAAEEAAEKAACAGMPGLVEAEAAGAEAAGRPEAAEAAEAAEMPRTTSIDRRSLRGGGEAKDACRLTPGAVGPPSTSSNDNKNQLCVVCIDSPRSHILVPCGHVCLCAACAEREVWDECPVCRTSTSMVLRAFFV